MERKDYAEKFMAIKNDILQEIVKILGTGKKHDFKKTFYIHYSDGEVFNTEVCAAVEVNDYGDVSFHIIDCVHESDVIGGDLVFAYDSNSYLDILDNLKKEVREKKLSHLREIVKKHKCSIDFDGTFDFTIHNGGDDYICQLTALRITKSGKLEVDDTCDGDKFTNPEEEISDKDLDKLIAYVESKCYKTYEVTICESRSRKVEIQAHTFDEAVEKAKNLLRSEPLNDEDSNGIEFY